jgi:hypothetical protein
MRGMRSGLWLVIAVGACWADFPESRFSKTPDQAIADYPQPPDRGPVDQRVPVEAADLPQLREARPPDRTGDLRICVANIAIECTTDYKAIVKCSPSGFGTVEVDCSPHRCRDMLRRCDGCNITDPASCSGANLVTCSLDGLPQSTPCPKGCKDGKCCVDGDGDGFTPCDGDCNDGNTLVHPGQKSFFETAAAGSYDYDCNGKDELQYPDQVNCHGSGGSCSGDGWTGQVPKCGDGGQFVVCQKQGPDCNQQPAVPKKQACR